MIKKTIKYMSYDDVEVTEDYWFHLGKAGLIEIELSTGGLGLEEWIKKVLRTQDAKAVLDMYKRFIGLSVGERTEDGKFVKSRQISDEFTSSEAYGELLMEMFQKPEAGSEFLRALLSKDVRATVEEVEKKQKKLEEELDSKLGFSQLGDVSKLEANPSRKTLEEYTPDELYRLPQEEFDRVAGKNFRKWNTQVRLVAFNRRANPYKPGPDDSDLTFEDLMNMSEADLTKIPQDVVNKIMFER